jgi:hypothetical protein
MRDIHATPPPPELRARVVATLRRSGYIGSEAAPWLRRVIAAGAIAAALLVGFVAGRTRIDAAPSGNNFLLLLYEDAGYRDDRPSAEIVAEYAGWADSLGRAGALVLGEKLGDARIDVVGAGASGPPAASGGPGPTGLFIVRTANTDSAAAIARSAPHIRQGGRIVVRPIVGGER